MEDAIEVRTRDLLTLIVILNEFEDFNNKVIDLIKNKNDYSFNKIQKLSKNEKVIGAKKLKDFYNDNSEIINVINSYSNIGYFIDFNYDLNNGQLKDGFNQLYNYLLKNKDKLNGIIDLLIRIEKLGFENIFYNDKLDFSKNSYKTSSQYYLCEDFYYLDNMYVVPTYDGEKIEYKTKGSSYEMKLQKGFKNTVYKRSITFNDLLVNPNRLPSELTKEETLDVITKLRYDIQSQYDILRESINMSLCIDDLKSKYCYLYDLANMCDVIEIKMKLLDVLKDLEEDILEIEYLSNSYEKTITNKNNVLSEEKVNIEKKKELKRRKTAFID